MQRQYQYVSRLRLLPEELLLCLAWLLSCFIAMLIFDEYDTSWWITLSVLTGLYLIVAAVYFPLLCFRTSYSLIGQQLHYRTGVFFSRDEIICRQQIVYVTLLKHPLTPILRIATVIIRAPGATIYLRGVRLSDAKRLVRQLAPENEL